MNAVAWAPNGRFIASATEHEGQITLWRVTDGVVDHTLDSQDWINSLAYSPDGRFLAVGLESDKAQIWEAADGTLLYTIVGALSYGLTSVSFSPDNSLIALDIEAEPFNLGTQHVQVRQTTNWEPVVDWEVKGDGVVITGVVFSPDGERLAASTYKRRIQVWNLASQKSERMLISPDAYELVMTVVFSPNGQLLASASYEGKVRVWQVEGGELLYTFVGPTLEEGKGFGHAYFDCLAWSPNGDILALAASDGTIQLLRASDGELLKKLDGHTLLASSVTFSPDGKMLASVSLDGSVRLWGVLP
jgi:WD40 repeat protein